MSVSRNLSRAPAASLRDGLRPLLTEPVRRSEAPYPHEGSDNSWQVLTMSTTYNDDDGRANEKAKREVAQCVYLHVANNRGSL
jgi:hypothetical protein